MNWFSPQGTLINIVAISLALFGVSRMIDLGIPREDAIAPGSPLEFVNIPFLELLVFATIISAVDPVAVLSIFKDLEVNQSLYFIVFGESLFNGESD